MPNTEQLLYQTDKSSHRSCSIKRLFLKISQYSQESTCIPVSFLTFLKRDPGKGSEIFTNTYFEECLRTLTSKLALESYCLEPHF